jgi:carbon storage regulator
MLVLSRLEGQVITIGDNIRVTIVEVRGGKVRVGIDAPRDLQVLRAELVEQTPEGSGNG